MDPKELNQEKGVLPSQWADLVGQRGGLPGRRLLLATLIDAIGCLQGNAYCTKGERLMLKNQAKGWFASRRRDHLFSFEVICDVLELNAPQLRSRLLSRRTIGSLEDIIHEAA